MTAEAEPPQRVDLAREPDFRLGVLAVSPSAGRVRGPAGEQRVEPRVMEVLIVLARAAGGTVTRDALIDACWGGRIVSDDAVSRAVAQARALARGVEPAPFAIETVPKIGFRLTAGEPADASPPEDAPPPPPRSADASPLEPSAPARFRPAPRRLAQAAAALATIGAVAAGTWWLLGRTPAGFGRVEVVAFQARGGDPDVRKVSQEGPEAIIRTLSRIGDNVAPDKISPDAGGGTAELRITGAVETTGDGAAVNTQVLDRASGQVLLSGRYVMPRAHLDELAQNAASRVSANVHCALEDRGRERLTPEAMSLLLNACASVFDEGNQPSRMLALTRRLVRAAPRFGKGHAMHAIGAALAAQQTRPGSAERKALVAETETAAHLALRFDPRAAKAYSALALLEGALDNDLRKNWLAIERDTSRALAIDPDLPPAHNEYALMLRQVGRLQDALLYHRTLSGSSDPRNGDGDPRTAMLLAATGDLAGAREEIERLESITEHPMNSARATIAFWWEDPRDALARLPALMRGEPPELLACETQILQALLTVGAGPSRRLPPICDTALEPPWRVRALARLGDVDDVFEALRGQSKIYGGTIMFYYPEMRRVRADPRFWTLARDARLIEYWQATGHWPDFCAEPGLGYDCKAMAAAALRAAPEAPPRTAAR